MSSILPPSDFSGARAVSVTTTGPDEPSPSADARDASALFRSPAPLPSPVPEPQSFPLEVRDRTVESVRERAEGPGEGEAPDGGLRAQEKLEQAAAKLKEARDAGVELAKAGFWRRMCKVATSAIAVGIAAALTAVSFGGAAPLLGIACANLVINAGDAVCAYRAWENAEDRAAGKTPRHELPEGTSCVKNLLHKAAKALGASPETAQKVAKVGNAVISLGLAVSSFALGQVTAALPHAELIASVIGNAINTLLHGTIAMRAMIENSSSGAMRSAAIAAQKLGMEAMALDPGVQARDKDEQRLLAFLDQDSEEHAKMLDLIGTACKDFGEERVNAAIAVGALLGVGKAVMEL